METGMKSAKAMLDRALADKAQSRLRARQLSWPEKIKTIERLRDATRVARSSMKAARRSSS